VIPPLSDWPADLREEYFERASIRAESLPVDQAHIAEELAKVEVWQRHQGKQEKLW